MPEFTTARQALEKLSTSIDPDKLADMDATWLFDLSGEGGGRWTVVIADGQITVGEGKTATPTVTIEATTEDLVALINGTLNPMAAFMQGRLKVKGDMSAAMRLQGLLSS